MLAFKWMFGSVFGSTKLDLAFMAALVLVGVGAATVVVCHNLKLLSRIRTLNAWVDSVLGGNLEAKVDLPAGDDEISRLARSLETMVSHIKASYANLHQEAISHKQRAEMNEQRATASQIGAKHLSDALMRLKESQNKTINEERFKALEQVAKGVTHDFSEALTPIMASTDLLLARPELMDDKEKLLEYVRSIRHSADQGRAVIRHLAGFFHQMPVAPATVDVNRAVRIAMEQVESAWRSRPESSLRHMLFRTHLGTVPPVSGNEDDVRTSVACLITNAIEAMPNGGTVTVATRTASQSVVVDVGDTGKGMPEEVKARSVEPFFSTKGSPHKGMGLTLAASTARSHGGDIHVESDPATGTRVTLSFPSHGAQTPAAAPRLIERPPAVPEQLSVIVVDDDRATRDVIALATNAAGHRATAVSDADQCLARMRETVFDVAIVDFAMPGMRGDELAVIISRTYPDTAILMLTGFGDIMAEQNDVPEFVDIMIPKPISADELLAVLKKATLTHWENKHRTRRIAHIARPSHSHQRAAETEHSFKWEG